MWNRVIVAVAATVYVLCSILSQLLLSTPGGRIPLYTAMLVAGAMFGLSTEKRLRYVLIPLVLLAAAMLLYEHDQEEKFQERTRVLREQLQKSALQPTTSATTTQKSGHE